MRTDKKSDSDRGLPELFGFIVGLVIGVIITGILLS